MSTEMLPNTPVRPTRIPQSEDRQEPRQDSRSTPLPTGASSGAWKLGLFVCGLLAVVISVAALAIGTATPASSEPRLTHTIRRGDLVVTVTEQGTLESSNNTEIKCRVRGFSTVTWVIPGGTMVKQGDELVRLDTKVIEETVSLTKTNAHMATATLERTKADVARAEIAIDAYKEGRYRSQLKALEKEVEVAKRNLRTAQTMLDHSETLFRQGYVTDLEVEGNAFTVTQAELELKVRETERDVLERFTRQMRLEELNGNLIASKSKLEADKAGLAMDLARRDRAQEELKNCVITADRSGMVIYPSAAAWKRTPDVAEGATVRKDQVLLLMPDLSKMQVKVGIHESIVDNVRPGMAATVTLPEKSLSAKVSSVASVTRPAGWWTGNVVKYDTIIELPAEEGLRPGMSAEVEIMMAQHKDVLTIPVAAVVETDEGDFCWIRTAEATMRRSLRLGDSNDVFIVVEAGVKEGEQVVLNPQAYIDEAQSDALNTLAQTESAETETEPAETEPAETEPAKTEPADRNLQRRRSDAEASEEASAPPA